MKHRMNPMGDFTAKEIIIKGQKGYEGYASRNKRGHLVLSQWELVINNNDHNKYNH